MSKERKQNERNISQTRAAESITVNVKDARKQTLPRATIIAAIITAIAFIAAAFVPGLFPFSLKSEHNIADTPADKPIEESGELTASEPSDLVAQTTSVETDNNNGEHIEELPIRERQAPDTIVEGPKTAGFPSQPASAQFSNSFLRVIPTSIAITSNKRSVRISTEFHNLTNEPLLLGFIKPVGPLETAALSDAGDNFRYNSITGLSTIHNQTSARSDANNYTSIDPNSHAVVIWEFGTHSNDEVQGSEFSFSGHLFRLNDSGAKRVSVGLSGVRANKLAGQ